MARRRKSNGLFAVVLVIVLVLLILLVTNNEKENSFIVICDGKVMTSEENIIFTPTKTYVFSIIDKTATDGQSFSVHLAVHQVDATFTVDGREVELANLQDISSDFIKDVTEDGFVLSQEVTLRELLAEKFGGKDVVVPSGNIFDLVVTSADGNYVIKIPIYFGNKIESIELDKVHIVF